MGGFVYKWTNTVNNKWYIGSRKGTPDDGYRHSSPVVESAEKKYGQECFIREILYEGPRYRQIEGELLSSFGAAHDRQSYNRCNIIGTDAHTDETKEKIAIASSKHKKGKTWEEIYGVEGAAKRKAEMSKRMKALPKWHAGKTMTTKQRSSYGKHCKGKKLSEEHKERISTGLYEYNRNKRILKEKNDE